MKKVRVVVWGEEKAVHVLTRINSTTIIILLFGQHSSYLSSAGCASYGDLFLPLLLHY